MRYVALPPRARIDLMLGDQLIAELTTNVQPTADQIRDKLREHGLTPTWVSNRAPSWWPVASRASAYAIASYEQLKPRTLDLGQMPPLLRVWRVTHPVAA